MKTIPALLLAASLLPLTSLADPARVLLADADSKAGQELAASIAPILKQSGAVLEKSSGFPDESKLLESNVLLIAGNDLKPLPKSARTALEKFAKKGGGIVALGGALGAGDWMKPLIGGAWTPQSRKFSNKLMLFVLTDNHPVTRNASPFDLDDETWYDLDTDASIKVLASAFTPKVTSERVDPRSPERLDRANVYDLQPQMWAFEAEDKHRAVVLTQQQEKTLSHPSVRSFLLRAIAWTAKQNDTDGLCSKDDLAALRYPQDGPKSGADTVKSFELHPDFTASVIASEPLINKPIAMQWDGSGRLWVAETPEYPNGRRPLSAAEWKETGVLKPGNYERPATDRISILSEPDAKGQFTKKAVFHEGLDLVTGFCLYGDGVIAVNQPDIVFIHGEGPSQKVERLYTGFTPGDTHFVANHFIAAPDGWIYANTGSGPKAESVSNPSVKAQLSAGVFRFKPDGSAIEQVSSKGGNGFGADITADGEIFFNQATSGNPVQHVALPEWILSKGTSRDLKTGAESVINQRKVIRSDMPDRAPFMQIDVVGGYSASCASSVYEAAAWPAEWNRSVFCTEPILDIIHHEKLVPNGASYSGEMVRENAEFLRSRDFWFFPIDVQFGPDGAMYVLDFYAPVVAHSDTRGPQHSRAGASVRPDRDHYFGRIYRIQHKAAKSLPQPNLSTASAIELAEALKHPNRWTAFTAHRLLMSHANAEQSVSRLTEMASTEATTHGRSLALWALARLGKLDATTLQRVLKSEDTALRKVALLVAESLGPKLSVDLSALLHDPDARVRLTALRAMASSPLNTGAAKTLLATLPALTDQWSKSAAIAAAASNAQQVLLASLALDTAPNNALLDLAASLARKLASSGQSEDLVPLIQGVADAPVSTMPLARTILESVSAVRPPKPQAAVAAANALKKLLEHTDPSLAASALPIASAWVGEVLKDPIEKQIARTLALAEDRKADASARATAAKALLLSKSADPLVEPRMVELLKSKLPDLVAIELVGALASAGDAGLGKRLVPLLPELAPLPQNALFDALAGRTDWANAILDALEKKELKISLFGPVRLGKLRQHPDTETAKRALLVIEALGGGTNPAKNELIAKLESEITAKSGDPEKGKALFSSACATCHQFGKEGNDVGPVLDGIGVHGTHELLIHVLDPSRVVDNEHRTWNIALKSGAFAVGIISRENERSLLLKHAGGVAQEIAVADIRLRQEVPQSLMPEGFEALGADGLRDLFTYLAGGSSKFRALNLAQAFTTDTNGGLYNSRDARMDTIHPVKFGVVTVENVPFSLPSPSSTPMGGNVIVLKPDDGKSFASSLPQQVSVPVGFSAGNLHFLGGVAGWGGGPEVQKPAMKVTIEHANGKKQVEELSTGDVFIDYVSGSDVPGSKRVDGIVQRNHVRYFSIPVSDRAPITKLVLESYKNGVSPTTLAITADSEEPKARTKSDAKPTPPPPPQSLPASGETLPAKAENGQLRVLLIGGGSSHDFERFFHQADAETLKKDGKTLTAYTSNAAEAVSLMPNADVIVISANHASFGQPEFQQPLNLFADSGRGIVVVHAGAWYNWAPVSGYNKRFVGGGARSHGAGEFAVYNRKGAHPVMAGIEADFKIKDEHYRIQLNPEAEVEVLAETEPEKQTLLPYPSVWVVKDSKTRIVGIGLGHGAEAHTNPAYQGILRNAVRWVAGK